MNSEKQNKIGLIGVPLGFGAGRVGSELGVNAMRVSWIRGRRLCERIQELGYSVTDHGDADIVKPLVPAQPIDNPKYLPEVVTSTQIFLTRYRRCLIMTRRPVILGGDHTIAIGTFSAVSAAGRSAGTEVGLISFDAHADINTPETSTTGNIPECRSRYC